MDEKKFRLLEELLFLLRFDCKYSELVVKKQIIEEKHLARNQISQKRHIIF